MSIILDYSLREYIPHNDIDFPITYFHDELEALPNFAGPLHWHPDFEIATAVSAALDYQVDEHHIMLEAGLLAATIFPIVLVFVLFIINKRNIKN